MTISNCGHDERNKYHGGLAGDQTGGEYKVIAWYNRPWKCILRHPNSKVRSMIAKMAKAAAKNDKVGYDQYQRMTFYNALKAVDWDPSAIKTKCEADCSSSTAAIVIGAGYRTKTAALQKVNPHLTTYDMRSALKSAGFKVYTSSKYLTSDAYLKPGDILLNDNAHVAINLSTGSKVKTSTSSSTTSMSAEIKKIALEVIDGEWGNGEDREKALKAAGYNYNEVQKAVNELLK